MAMIVLLRSLLPKKEIQALLSDLWAGVDWHRPLIITLLALGFILVLEWLGFILSSFLLMFILFKWEEKLSWGKAILIPVVTVSCTYLLFGFILKASLPRGMLGF
jgi:putative tricarboxylic transport membrane protein